MIIHGITGGKAKWNNNSRAKRYGYYDHINGTESGKHIIFERAARARFSTFLQCHMVIFACPPEMKSQERKYFFFFCKKKKYQEMLYLLLILRLIHLASTKGGGEKVHSRKIDMFLFAKSCRLFSQANRHNVGYLNCYLYWEEMTQNAPSKDNWPHHIIIIPAVIGIFWVNFSEIIHLIDNFYFFEVIFAE